MERRNAEAYASIPWDSASINSNQENGKVTRKRLKVKDSRVIRLSNLLSPAECQYLIDAAENLKFESLEKEYPVNFRNNQRLLFHSDAFCSELWKRVLPKIKNDIIGSRPIGIANQGIWNPTSLNPLFRLCRYQPGQKFSPHFDGSFAKYENERSIFTLMIYLNDNFKGGETQFLEKPDSVALTDFQNGDTNDVTVLKVVTPQQGSALVFNHDVLHQGLTVEDNVKYVLRTDILFRLDGGVDSAYNIEDKSAEHFQKADQLEAKHDVDGSTSAYLKGLAVQAPKANMSVMPNTAPVTIHDLNDDIMINIFQMLCQEPFKEYFRFSLVCKRWERLSKDNEIWRQFFRAKHPLTFTLETKILPNLPNASSQHQNNWLESIRSTTFKKPTSRQPLSLFLDGRRTPLVLQLDLEQGQAQFAGQSRLLASFPMKKSSITEYAHHSVVKSDRFGADLHYRRYHGKEFDTFWPMINGKVEDKFVTQAIINSVWNLQHIVKSEIGPPTVIMYPPCLSSCDRYTIIEAIHSFNVPQISMINSAVCAVLSTASLNGLVAWIGRKLAWVAPVINGIVQFVKVKRHGEMKDHNTMLSYTTSDEGLIELIDEAMSQISDEDATRALLENVAYYGISTQDNQANCDTELLHVLKRKYQSFTKIKVTNVEPMRAASALALCVEFPSLFFRSSGDFEKYNKEHKKKAKEARTTTSPEPAPEIEDFISLNHGFESRKENAEPKSCLLQ